MERRIATPRTNASPQEPSLELIEIRDPVSSELTILSPLVKTAQTIGGGQLRAQDPVVAPAIFMVFGRVCIGPRNPCWAAPVSLGDQQAEPDASLFTIPADYRRHVVTVPARTASAAK